MIAINKIQFLADKGTEHPIFYCHGSDDGHNPYLQVSVNENGVYITGENLLFKVKRNPQFKNRVDIYMPVSAANELGRQLSAVTQGIQGSQWRTSNAEPGKFASGRMALPNIIQSQYGKAVEAIARVSSGTMMSKRDAYVNIDLESPHETHIKMNEVEVHIGIALDSPVGYHNPDLTTPVTVAESELQRGTGETNPVPKVEGHFSLLLSNPAAAGLGQLLSKIASPI